MDSVHPHACGEYISGYPPQCGQGGSSPRVWGIRWAVRSRPAWMAVHPHACGEYRKKKARPSSSAGSSPRVWGIQVEGFGDAKVTRFIPTRVGNTRRWKWPLSHSSVHPHACGEYRSTRTPSKPRRGSSPRVWGILFRKMQEITDCWQSSSVLPSHVCCKPAPMTIKRGRSFVKRLLPLVKHCPAGQSRSLDVTCPDRRNARPRS